MWLRERREHDGTGSSRALPAELPRRRTTRRRRNASRSAACCSGIRFCPVQKDVACATCHHPAFGYSDGLDLSIGANGVGLGAARTFAPGHAARLVKRNSQTVLNVAFNGLDGRRPSPRRRRADVLGSQSSQPRGAGAGADQGARRNARRRYPEDHAVRRVVSRLNAIAGVPPALRSRVRRNQAGERAATSGARSPRSSGRWSPQMRRSIGTCAATRPR